MNTLQVEGVGLMAPGLVGWPNGRAVLIGARPYVAEAMPTAIAALLPANERRRTTATVKLALQVAQEAALHADIDPSTTPTVLASSGGDSEVLDKICAALTLPDRPVSPTHFHHSVHNTPAGYWSIATRCAAASLSLSAYDDSFAAGLMEAAALAWTDRTRVLLVAYDLPSPFPLSERR
ncbi:MAG TPA: beta-ketoacyl synthase chain length factor, partial [Candidatus Competibacter phosphatis]|nr:beta-ketoacyl synthase chain length factor [Candidatus Competibacter phosphatis]